MGLTVSILVCISIDSYVLNKFVSYLKEASYTLSPSVEKAKNNIYELLSKQ